MRLVKEVTISMLNDKFRKSGFGVTLTCGVQGVEDVRQSNMRHTTWDFFRGGVKELFGRSIITMKL